jgi:UDP-2-acetamido-2,6-beta-L-arabino-hexul-4-ose reductase
VNILVTGAKGFIGKNLIFELKNRGYDSIFEYDKDSTLEQLEIYTKDCDFVFHLAGINRPDNENEFTKGNVDFTSVLIDCLKKNNNKAQILMSSSIQSTQDNPYGKSKRAAEELLLGYQDETGVTVSTFRLENVFGKWCRPNYNSVVATFCHNIANNLPIIVNDMEHQMKLVYIDDVIDAFIFDMESDKVNHNDCIKSVSLNYSVKLGEVADLIYSFKASRDNLNIPDMSDALTKKLYSTYLSYLPKEQFLYPLTTNIEARGSFTEFLKTSDRGQISINISKPGVAKGNHWHQTKVEKFLVVSGQGIIRFRKIDEKKIIEYKVSEDKLEVVDIPPGYTHNITNTGKSEMVTIMWANETFNQDKPDTYNLTV